MFRRPVPLVAEAMEITDDSSTSPAYGPAPNSDSGSGAESESTSVSQPSGEGSSQAGVEESAEQVVHICKRCMTSRSDPGGVCPECGDTLLPIRSTSDSYLGQTVGEKFKLVEQIGSGGMGEVYLGVNEPLDQRVAVKFLNEQYTANEQVIMRFLNEARSYCRVTHPNAVTLLDYGQHTDGSLYIITEYVDGLSLTGAIDEEGALAPEQAISIVMQCCEVLASAHDQGIIHRDLKPDNLMLMPAGNGRYTVKVLDFGIAKIIDDDGPALTETGSVFGTPEFMSPEQAEGKTADARSDLYALGIILFYASTARLPFDGESQYSVLEKQIHEAPPKASSVRDDLGVPAPVERVIERCLQKDREKRYQTAQDLFEALQEALEAISGSGPTTGFRAEGEWSDTGADPVNLTEIIEDSAEVQTRGYPAGEPEIDSRADTATGPRGGPVHGDRFEVGDRLRSIDLSREEPREHGVTLPDSRSSDPWRRAGLILTALFVATIGGWQIWSSIGASGAGAAGATDGAADATQKARRDLAAANAALDEGKVEAAEKRVERAASTLSPEKRSDPESELFAITKTRLRDVRNASRAFRKRIEAGECERANEVGEDLIGVAPDVAGRVAAMLNECTDAAGGGGAGDSETRVRRDRSEPDPGSSDRGSEERGGPSEPDREEATAEKESESDGEGEESAESGGARASESEPSGASESEGSEASEEETSESAGDAAGAPAAGEEGGRSAESTGDGPAGDEGATPSSAEDSEAAAESEEPSGSEGGEELQERPNEPSDGEPRAAEPGSDVDEGSDADGDQKMPPLHDEGAAAEDASDPPQGAEDSERGAEAPAPAGESGEESDSDGETGASGDSDVPDGMARPPDQL